MQMTCSIKRKRDDAKIAKKRRLQRDFSCKIKSEPKRILEFLFRELQMYQLRGSMLEKAKDWDKVASNEENGNLAKL